MCPPHFQDQAETTPSVKDYYSKMEPRDATLMVCDDIAATLGEQPNGTS